MYPQEVNEQDVPGTLKKPETGVLEESKPVILSQEPIEAEVMFSFWIEVMIVPLFSCYYSKYSKNFSLSPISLLFEK